MRFSIFAAVAAFGPAVLAQSLLSQIPQCAQTCFGNNLGSCGALDIACICGNTAVIDKVSCCVFATCSASDIQATTQFAVQLCKLQNINVNTAPVCASGSSTVAGSSTASGSAASAASAASASTSGSARSSGTIAPSASVSGGSVVVGSRTSSASAAANTGAAPMQTAGAHLGLGMAMAGLIAAL